MSNKATAMVAGALSGAAAGVATGLIDGLWSFGALGQYLPTFAGKLGLLLHLALSYALAATIIGAGVGLLLSLLAATAGPSLVSALCHGRAQGKPAINVLALVVAAVPTLSVTSTLAYLVAYQNLVLRKHPGLVTASSMVIAIVFLGIGIIATLLLADVIARGLPRLGLKQSVSKPAAAIAGLGCLAVCSLATYLIWRGRLAGLPLGQVWIAVPALLSVIVVPALLPMALARIDGEKPRELALPLVVCALPLLAVALGVAFRLAARNVGAPPALLIAQSMSWALLAAGAALTVSVFLARLLERPLRRLAHPRAPGIAAVLMVAVALAIGAALWWKTLGLLRLRPLIVASVLLALGIAARSSVGLAARRIPSWAVCLALPLLFLGVVVSGNSEPIQKAQVMHAGLSEPLARIYRHLGDWDRDGSSRWLGGGDCDDGNPLVNPRADEIPFDGIDNNCLRGDVTERSAEATHFASLPPKLPADFNVLFLTIDTIRADHLGAYGYARNTTPNIDALAKDGTLFQNGWAHAPSTRYSIPAMLTGRHPLNVRYTQIPGQWPGLSTENTTIAEVLKARGLSTGAILNYWYFDAHRKMNQGFDYYDNTNKRLHKAVRGKGPAKTSGSSSKEQSDKAIEFVDKHASERFFLWVHYYDPHYDYETHPGTPEFGDSKIDAYDHEIAYTDQHIGRVIDDLKTRGLYEKTVIVLTGDHGEGFGEHGIDLHGYHLYAAQTKVPFIMRVPGTEPSIVTMPASHVDVLPTLANLAGAKSTRDMLGRSLLGVISGEEDRDQERYVFQQLSYENNNEYRGAASNKCHVLYNVSPSRSWELYRVDTDPMETRDIINTPGECANAREELEAWYDFSQIPEGATEALLSQPPTLSEPIQIDFAKGISLVQALVPSVLRRGESASIEFTWNAHARPPKGWKVFVHFEKSPGQPSKHGRFTADHQPPRPFAWWSKGQFIRYGQTVTLPRNQPVGRYDMWLGIYKGSARLDVKAPDFEIVDRRVKITTIEVTK